MHTAARQAIGKRTVTRSSETCSRRQVRVVEEVTPETAKTTASSVNAGSVRVVSAAGGTLDSCYVEDLTVCLQWFKWPSCSACPDGFKSMCSL